MLASSAGDPFVRFDTEGVPWRRVDGVRIAPTAAEFAAHASGTVYATFVNRDAAGDPVAAYFSTTGDTADQHCQDWTSTADNEFVPAGWMTSAAVDEFWSWGANACSAFTRILCAQE